MRRKFLFILCFCLGAALGLKAQDTFSIVAIDSVTGEVGSAGASCVNLSSFPGFSDDFLGELFPGVGAINTQAYYLAGNQANARNRMNLGETPSQIITWLVNNDVQNTPELRQYGITAFVNGSPESAAHTGSSTDNYKGHITGPNYSIQGNILLGQAILDSMEARFLRAEGDLACKLMAALQGANVVGADTRCASNGTSSLFAFVKVAQPSDSFGNPSFVLSVRTSNGQGIEPIDSLQSLFDGVNNCALLSRGESQVLAENFRVAPNPTQGHVEIHYIGQDPAPLQLLLTDALGRELQQQRFSGQVRLDLSGMSKGLYWLQIRQKGQAFTQKLILE